MDAQLKQKWLEALRSGEYKQGKHVLRTQQDEFCCLGVLCHVVSPNGWSTDSEGGFFYGDRKGYLPVEISRATAFPTGHELALAGMNDNGESFAEIADWIEANIPAEASQS